MDHAELRGLTLNRVELSPDKSHCFVYFWCPGGVEEFSTKLEHLKLFKPSLKKAIAQEINSRYVPDIRFRFDAMHEKQQHIESLLDQVHGELHGEDVDSSDDE